MMESLMKMAVGLGKSMRLLPLTQGKYTIVDDADYAKASTIPWYPRNSGDNCYAYNPNQKIKNFRHLHRLLLNPENQQSVDHENGNGLDNRRKLNLRACSHSENHQGFKQPKGGKVFDSIYRGVSYCKRDHKWIAFIKPNGEGINLGRFDTAQEAAAAYDAAALKFYGKFAQLNLGPVRRIWYLASPYSHPDEEIKNKRAEQAAIAAAELTRARALVFSPIVHSHALHRIAGLRGTWDFWQKIDLDYLNHSALLVVLMLPGWKESVGVAAEIEYATRIGLPVDYLNFHLLPCMLKQFKLSSCNFKL
jgi:hypothetical protein